MARTAEAREKCIFQLFFFFVVLSMNVRGSSKAGLKEKRSCGNVEGLARTVSERVSKEKNSNELGGRRTLLGSQQ